MTAFFAFLHHIAAFAFVAALVIELVLLRDDLTARRARTLQLADLVFGVSAGVVLAVGFLRVFYFEKGPSYYFHSIPFIAKVSLFAIVGLLSIYPTMEFVSWRKSLKQRRVPAVPARKLHLIRSLIHLELIAVALLILCAALMAKGVGHAG